MLCIFNLAHLVRRYNRKKGIKCFCFYFIQAKGVQESVLLSLLRKTSVVGNVDWNKNSVFFGSPPRRTRLQWTMHTWMSASASWLSPFFHSKCTAMHQYVLILLQCTLQPCVLVAISFFLNFYPQHHHCLFTLSTRICVLYKWNISHWTRGIDKSHLLVCLIWQ